MSEIQKCIFTFDTVLHFRITHFKESAKIPAFHTVISVKSFDNTKDFLISRRHLIQKRFKLPFRFAIPKFFA